MAYVCQNKCAVNYFLFAPEYVFELKTFDELVASDIPAKDVSAGIAVLPDTGEITKHWGNGREGVPESTREAAQELADQRVDGVVVCPSCGDSAKWMASSIAVSVS